MALDKMSFNTDSEMKRQAENIAGELGTDLSAVLNIFLYAFVRNRGIPFEVSLAEMQNERQQLNKVLDLRQAVIDEGNEQSFAAHEDVKQMIGIADHAV